MKQKTKKLLTKIGLFVAIVGGLVHVLLSIGVNPLFFPGGKLVQFVAGATTVVVSIVGWKMTKKR